MICFKYVVTRSVVSASTYVYRYLSFINNVLCKDSFEDCVFHVHNQLGMCTTFHSSQFWGHAVWTLVSATCSHMHLTVTSMVGARTMQLMEEPVGFPLGACAAARSCVACRWGILPITCVTSRCRLCAGGDTILILISACDYQTRTCVELTFNPTVILLRFMCKQPLWCIYIVPYNSIYNCLVYCVSIYVYLYCDKMYTRIRPL